MANQITVISVPQSVAPLAGGNVTIIATVRDSVTGMPVSGINVAFSTATTYAVIAPSSGITNANGTVQTFLSYPSPSPGPAGFTGIGLVRVVAAITGATASVVVNFYDPSFRQVRVLNTVFDGPTGTYVLPYNAIVAGVQAIVYFPVTTEPGDIITFYWGNATLEHAVNSGALSWLININNLLITEEALSPGVYTTWYNVEDSAGNIAGAQSLIITILDTPYSSPVLLAPTFDSSLNGIINQQAASNGVVITLPIAQQPIINTPGFYYIYMRLTTLAGGFLGLTLIRENLFNDPNVNVNYRINGNVFANLNGVNAEFYYTVSQTNPEGAFRSFSTRMYIDTVPPGQ